MTYDEKLKMTEVLSEEHDETILSTYLTLAENKILNHLYPFGADDEDLPTEYDTLQCEIACYLIMRRGSEGETRHSENGIDRTYENADLPRTFVRRIVPRGTVL